MGILRCFPYNSGHSAVSVKAQIKRIISDWNLPPQPVAVVRDGASNVTKALSDMNGVSYFPILLLDVIRCHNVKEHPSDAGPLDDMILPATVMDEDYSPEIEMADMSGVYN